MYEEVRGFFVAAAAALVLVGGCAVDDGGGRDLEQRADDCKDRREVRIEDERPREE